MFGVIEPPLSESPVCFVSKRNSPYAVCNDNNLRTLIICLLGEAGSVAKCNTDFYLEGSNCEKLLIAQSVQKTTKDEL
jgi:hypothetical protein